MERKRRNLNERLDTKSRTSIKEDINKNKMNTNHMKVNNKEQSKKYGNIKYSGTVMVNERKRKKKKFKIVAIFVIILLLIVCVYLLCTLDEFNLKDINLNDTEKYSKYDIIEKSGLEIGKNTFTQFFACDRNSVTTLPYVESIKLKLKFPNEIDINVIERTGKYFAYNKDRNAFYKLSEDGYILESADINSKTNGEILVIGITFDDDVMLGKKINDIDLSKLNVYEKIENEFKKDKINGDITKVSFENSLTTITINDKLNVIFPNDTDLEYKMVFFKTILESIPENSVGVIDMTKTKPTYSSF